MNTALPLAAFLFGLASTVHCLGMCGGIVTAFSSSQPVTVAGPRPMSRWPVALSFNLGRIATYGAAGLIAGALGSAGSLMGGLLDVQLALFILANVFLVLMGLHLAGASTVLARFEALGRPLWRAMAPLAARFSRAASPGRAVVAGALWGFLPCGLVYGMLGAAVASGTPQGGALTMLAFGLGTLPGLLVAGMALVRLRGFVSLPAVRRIAGSLVLAFGSFGLARASGLAEAVHQGLLCL